MGTSSVLNQSSKLYATSEIIDAVIIGTGAGGAPVLARLAAAGLSTVALEAGRQWNPAEEYATDEMAQRELYWLDERLSGGPTRPLSAPITADAG